MKRVLSYKKPAFWVAAALLVACIAAAVCFLTDPEQSGTLQWARELQTDDIVNVELTVMPPVGGEAVPGFPCR